MIPGPLEPARSDAVRHSSFEAVEVANEGVLGKRLGERVGELVGGGAVLDGDNPEATRSRTWW